jgi:hypothetical protein
VVPRAGSAWLGYAVLFAFPTMNRRQWITRVDGEAPAIAAVASRTVAEIMTIRNTSIMMPERSPRQRHDDAFVV